MKELYKICRTEYENMFGTKKYLAIRIPLCYYRCIEYRVLVLIRVYLSTKSKYIKKKCRKKLALKYSIEIGINPKIGKNLRIAHTQGIIIGNEVIIGDNCKLYQQVTLGQKKDGIEGYGDDPIIGDNVIIFSGAKVFGKIHIGDNSIVGANAVVFQDVQNNHCAVGVPAKIIERKG